MTVHENVILIAYAGTEGSYMYEPVRPRSLTRTLAAST